MAFKKNIGRFLILLMLVAQLALAQHATVHFLEDQYTAAPQQDHDPAHPEKHDKGKICQICVTVKELGNVLASADVAVLIVLLAAVFGPWPLSRNLNRIPAAFYFSRAPPSFLC